MTKLCIRRNHVQLFCLHFAMFVCVEPVNKTSRETDFTNGWDSELK